MNLKNKERKRIYRKSKKKAYTTHTGHKLTDKEAKFIDHYIETGNQRQSVIEAGYSTKVPGAYAQQLLAKLYIAEEIEYRQKQLEDASIANAVEIRQYLTGVMRGEIKDQFGLETPISERTKAAQELAKLQTLDVRANAKGGNAEVKITLDWAGMGTGDEDGE